ncbi:MAG: C4-type zinc ribbon domain-containing protein [Myxococcota bacterium]
MRDTILALHQLQRIDSEAQQMIESAESIPAQIQELEHQLEVTRSELGKMNSEADELRKEQDELEGQVAEESAKHDKWKRRLNDIKSPREYQALSRELEMGERQVHNQEDRVLEIAQDLEDKDSAIEAKEEELRDQESRVRLELDTLRKTESEYRAEATARSEGRPAVAEKLPARILKKYEQLRQARSGLAVAVVKEGTCTGCQMKLRPQLVITLMRGDSLEFCTNCNRMLIDESLLEPNDATPGEED